MQESPVGACVTEHRLYLLVLNFFPDGERLLSFYMLRNKRVQAEDVVL